jgi:hypothetical protein
MEVDNIKAPTNNAVPELSVGATLIKHIELKKLHPIQRVLMKILKLGALFHDVNLIIYLILVLTDSQVLKFLKGDKSYGTIQVFNLYKTAGTTAKYRRDFVNVVTTLSAKTNTTIFVFTLPQFLAKYNHMRNALSKDYRRVGTLCSATINWANLFVQHGSIFRPEVRHWHKHIIKEVHMPLKDHPMPFYMLLLSATMPLGKMAAMLSMTGTVFASNNYIIRSSLANFSQETISMSHRIGNACTKELDKVIQNLTEQ